MLFHHHHVTQSSHSINAIGPAPPWVMLFALLVHQAPFQH
jgi:hypothetical protein